MSIALKPGPEGGLQPYADQINQLLSRGPVSSSLPTGGGLEASETRAGNPIELYQLSVPDVLKDHFLDRSVQSGWRFIIFKREEPIAIAELRAGANHRLQLSQLNRGPLAARLYQATNYALHAYGQGPKRYEARLLEIPELNCATLWLHNSTSEVLMPLIEGTTRFSDKWEDPEFPKRLKRRAGELMESDSAAPLSAQ